MNPFTSQISKFFGLCAWIWSINCKLIKIPSGELTNLPFIKSLAKFNVPIILSTGMANIEEVHDAINTIKITRDGENFIEPLSEMVSILHCT